MTIKLWIKALLELKHLKLNEEYMFSVVPVHISAAKFTWLKSFMFKGLPLASYWRLDAETTTIPPNFPPTICGREKVRKFWDNVYTTRARERGKIAAERAREEGREGTERRALTIGIHERSLPGGLACERTLCPVAFHPVHSLSLPPPPLLFAREQPCLPSHIFRGGPPWPGPRIFDRREMLEPAR